ncbi:MAG: acetyl-CoA carboxylase biotin carboxyl carrier protein subunit [Dehalococcoidia bacterium]|nr:acetyl-CoA carboxylase biotin carboxyl carrier protein subunit [Dehalococcoidia bacterium]
MASIEIPAPMAGVVRQVLVAVGDRVASGQELVVLESMKMEIPVESPAAGAVAVLLVAAGSPITEGQPLLRLEA